MENTLGKRISMLRKKEGLTQDALAERLGISSQAVSKWENDVSCPDISLLPKLAEIFGVSTDYLLGVTDNPETEKNSVSGEIKEIKKRMFKRSELFSITAAIFVLMLGVSLICRKAFNVDISVWRILLYNTIIYTGLLISIGDIGTFSIGTFILGIYLLLDGFGVIAIPYGNDLLIPIILIIWGISIIISLFASRKRKRRLKGGVKGNQRNGLFVEKGYFSYSLSFSGQKASVKEKLLKGGTFNVSFGEGVLDLTECETVEEGAVIDFNVSFGEGVIFVPKSFVVSETHSGTFMDATVIGSPDPDAKQILNIDTHVSFGQAVIKYK